MKREGWHFRNTRLTRLVAILFALAAAAEFAAFAPRPVRRVMLYFLFRAEAIAYSLVYWSARDNDLPFSWALPEGVRGETDASAALSLADWFRVLAIALRNLPHRLLLARLAKAHRLLEVTRLGLQTGLATNRPPIADSS